MQEQKTLLPDQRLRNIQDLFMQASLFHTSQERSPINMDQKMNAQNSTVIDMKGRCIDSILKCVQNEEDRLSESVKSIPGCTNYHAAKSVPTH